MQRHEYGIGARKSLILNGGDPGRISDYVFRKRNKVHFVLVTSGNCL